MYKIDVFYIYTVESRAIQLILLYKLLLLTLSSTVLLPYIIYTYTRWKQKVIHGTAKHRNNSICKSKKNKSRKLG